MHVPGRMFRKSSQMSHWKQLLVGRKALRALAGLRIAELLPAAKRSALLAS